MTWGIHSIVECGVVRGGRERQAGEEVVFKTGVRGGRRTRARFTRQCARDLASWNKKVLAYGVICSYLRASALHRDFQFPGDPNHLRYGSALATHRFDILPWSVTVTRCHRSAPGFFVLTIHA